MYESIHFSDNDGIASVVRGLKFNFSEENKFVPTNLLDKSNALSSSSSAYITNEGDFIHNFALSCNYSQRRKCDKFEVNGMSGDDLFAISKKYPSDLTGGDGMDLFAYERSDWNHNLNLFDPSEDKIVISQKGFKNLRLRKKEGVFMLENHGAWKEILLKELNSRDLKLSVGT